MVAGPNKTISDAISRSGGLADDIPDQYLLHDFLMSNYNRKLPPKTKKNEIIRVALSIELYQIIDVNEPRQYLLINAWIIERWKDHLLVWDPSKFGNITEILLPYDSVWRPDTTLYNSLEMDDAASKRLLNVKLTASREAALVEMLYPAIYKFSCMLDLRFFPFDTQATLQQLKLRSKIAYLNALPIEQMLRLGDR
ncbi:unnamed protein product [Toxocara canis]|uniref:Neurotransmitter-gated ion-channel ligand-binding domain-containing protein n=1 Tax=Toxocara canis TaxID=6265 RepID=A0A3P7EZ68_TOXCA|nr:unnamed protein product [Toxocara canis]